jgi:two-component system cell cycle sensor histidine kinase/response regulator CckA
MMNGAIARVLERLRAGRAAAIDGTGHVATALLGSVGLAAGGIVAVSDGAMPAPLLAGLGTVAVMSIGWVVARLWPSMDASMPRFHPNADSTAARTPTGAPGGDVPASPGGAPRMPAPFAVAVELPGEGPNTFEGEWCGLFGLGEPGRSSGIFVPGSAAASAATSLRDAARAGKPGRAVVRIENEDSDAVRMVLLGAEPGSDGRIDWWAVEVPKAEVDIVAAGTVGRAPAEAAWLDALPFGACALDADGRIRFANRVLRTWLGISEDAVARGGILLAGFLAEAPAALDLECGAEGGSRLVAAVPDVAPAIVARVPFAAAGPDGDLVIVRDLAVEVKRERDFEDTIRQAEESLRRFFDYAPVGIVIVDADGCVAETNAAFRSMTGLREDDRRMPTFLDFVAADDRARVTEEFDRTRRAGNPVQPIEVVLDRSGRRVVQMYVRRAGGADSDATDLIAYLVDSTDQRNLEAQFAQSQKMQAVGQLAGGIAHDFNNLLTAIIGYSDLLLQRHSVKDESFADIMQIKQNANRAANLVRQLLAFSRRQTLQPRVLALADVLTELSHLLRRLLGENIRLDLQLGRDVGLVRVDQSQFEQVIINLAVNARDAMPQGGVVTIRTRNAVVGPDTRTGQEPLPSGDYVLIEVADNGVGIPAANLDKIFEPFFTTKEVGAGVGLGLSTVYGIVKQTGGAVVAASEEGRGTTFRIYLPLHVAREDEATDAEVAPVRVRDLTGKGTVLIVEDEDPVRLFAARALQNKGYTVLQADSPEAALAILDDPDAAIDLAITDVVMPQMDGPSLIRKARERRPDLKVIFISGYAEDVFRRNVDDDMPFTFLPKPFNLKELAGTVKEVLG